MTYKIIFWISISFLFVGVGSFIAACSTTGTAYYSPDPNFDASTYLDPRDFGYRLELLNSKTQVLNASGQRSFKPVSFKGGLDSLQNKADVPAVPNRPSVLESVLLDVYVDTMNKITNIKVVESPYGYLTKKAIGIVMESEVSGARKDGIPVNSFIRVPLEMRVFVVTTTRDGNRN